MSEELKPCPFCGNNDPEYMNYGPEGQMVVCHDCGVVMDKNTKEEAIEAWNKRVPNA